jgi:phage protein D
MPQKAYKLLFDDEAVDEEFYGDLLALTVAEQAGASTLQLRLATRLEDDGSWRYLEDERLTPFTKVSVRLGFTGGEGLAGALGGVTGGNDGLEPVFDGYITSVTVSLGSAPGGTAIAVGALDTGVLLSLEEKVVAFANMSDSDIAQQILGAYGVAVTADSTATVHQEDTTTIVQRGSDLQFVRALARRNGFEFYFETAKEGDQVTAFFRPPQLDGTPQPDLAIQFGEESNLRSFSARLSAQRPLNVKAAQVDVQANSANSGEASSTQLAALGATDLNALVGGPLGSLVTPRAALAQMLVLGPPTSDPAELQTLAQAVRDEAGWFISASGEINSDAYGAVLRPHRLVLVKGAGTPYSGKYYVTAVTHELTGDGGYAQRFEARRNARDLDGSEQFGGAGLALPLP